MVERVDRKRLALLAAILGSFVAGLDATVVNVALPTIRDDLGGGLAGQQWISNAYLLTLASLILVGGSLGDLFGERRVFSLGVAGFGVASLVCAIAPSVELLVVARALQGIFGALLTPSALAVIIAAFPPAERGAAIGSWTAWTGIAFVVGPLAGGVLVDATSWRWIFLINIPFVLVTLFVVARAVEERPRDDARPHVDIVGAVLCAVGLGGPVYGAHPPARGRVGRARGVAADRRRRRAARCVRRVGAALAASRCCRSGSSPGATSPSATSKRWPCTAASRSTSSPPTLFLQQVAGYTAFEAGLATMPITVVMFLLSKRMGALADRLGPRLFMGGGPLLAAVGLLLWQRVGESAPYVEEVLPALVVFALGLSMTVAPLTATVLADADEHNAGIASGINNALARVAGLLGIAALGIIASGAITVESFHRVAAIAAGLVALGGILGLLGIVNPEREVECADCPGGAIYGASTHVAEEVGAVGTK